LAACARKLDTAELSVGFDAVSFVMEENPDMRELFLVVTEARLCKVFVVAFGADRSTEVSRSRQRAIRAARAGNVLGG
jgi:phage head maturation protease